MRLGASPLARATVRAAAVALAWPLGVPASGAGAEPPRRWACIERFAMGTRGGLGAWVYEPTVAFAAFEAALAEVHRLEVLLTSYRHPGWPDSDLMRLEAAAGSGRWVEVAPEVCAVLARASAVHRASGGAFDVTVAPLSRLVPTDHAALPPPVAPAQPAIDREKKRLGADAVALDCGRGLARLTRAGVALDASAVAKGAILDAAASRLRGAGLTDFVVEAGGDLCAVGCARDPTGAAPRPWRVRLPEVEAALSVPDGAAAPPRVEVALVDQALATSSAEARGFTLGGARLHHLIDPATGRSAEGARTVSVVAPEAAVADALATALFVLPPEAGARLVGQTPGASALWVGADDSVRLSGDFPLAAPLPAR